MDACPTVLTGETMRLTAPGAPEYLTLVLDFCEHAARLAGFGDHGARRCRLIAEELFHQVAQECQDQGRRDPCRFEATLTADGLNLCLTTDHLSWDPENEPAYSLADVLEGQEPAGLGLHLHGHAAMRRDDEHGMGQVQRGQGGAFRGHLYGAGGGVVVRLTTGQAHLRVHIVRG